MTRFRFLNRKVGVAPPPPPHPHRPHRHTHTATPPTSPRRRTAAPPPPCHLGSSLAHERASHVRGIREVALLVPPYTPHPRFGIVCTPPHMGRLG